MLITIPRKRAISGIANIAEWPAPEQSWYETEYGRFVDP
jgi:hypothetical protein